MTNRKHFSGFLSCCARKTTLFLSHKNTTPFCGNPIRCAFGRQGPPQSPSRLPALLSRRCSQPTGLMNRSNAAPPNLRETSRLLSYKANETTNFIKARAGFPHEILFCPQNKICEPFQITALGGIHFHRARHNLPHTCGLLSYKANETTNFIKARAHFPHEILFCPQNKICEPIF